MATDNYPLRRFAPIHGPLESTGRITLPKLPKPPAKLLQIDPELAAYCAAVQRTFSVIETEYNNLVQKLKQSTQPPVT